MNRTPRSVVVDFSTWIPVTVGAATSSKTARGDLPTVLLAGLLMVQRTPAAESHPSHLLNTQWPAGEPCGVATSVRIEGSSKHVPRMQMLFAGMDAFPQLVWTRSSRARRLLQPA
jgi:hypothetical protein